MANAEDELAWAGFIVTALGTVFMGIQALKSVAAKLRAELSGEVVCPNCGQPFSRQSFYSDEKAFPLTVGGKRFVSCPRCWYTFEA